MSEQQWYRCPNHYDNGPQREWPCMFCQREGKEMTPQTPEEIANELLSSFSWTSPNINILDHIAQALKAYGDRIRCETIDQCKNICIESAKGYRDLQMRARNDNDTQSAFAHLCEVQTALLLAEDIRKLGEVK